MSTSPTWSSSRPAGARSRTGAGRGELTDVHPVRFGELAPEGPPQGGSNLPLLLDVVVELSVELGRARLTLGEVMDLRRGSVIQLDKLAGEPADVLVNGKPIAKGEVVLLDEKFGVKINDIVTRARRARELP
ncbi:MAG TPA: flagellar motor switch protein FliN [Limnochordales bacterium]